MRQITNIINHWSAGSLTETVEGIRQMHIKNNGWRDIGYHRVILHPSSQEFKDSPPVIWSDLVKQGRKLNEDLFLDASEVGAHTFGYNSHSVGICTIGGPGKKLHPLQREALIQVNKIFMVRFHLPSKAIFGHRDFNATQCPGDEIYQILQLLRKGAI